MFIVIATMKPKLRQERNVHIPPLWGFVSIRRSTINIASLWDFSDRLYKHCVPTELAFLKDILRHRLKRCLPSTKLLWLYVAPAFAWAIRRLLQSIRFWILDFRF